MKSPADSSASGNESYRQRVKRELTVRCIHLRTKESFIGLPAEHERGFEGDEPIWWCDVTIEPLGPDGSVTCQDRCHAPGRRCYEPPNRPMA